MKKHWLLLLLFSFAPLLHASDRPLTYERVTLSVQSEAPVANDTLVAVLRQREAAQRHDHIDIELDPGMTVLTGETGAGKSILLDALGLEI